MNFIRVKLLGGEETFMFNLANIDIIFTSEDEIFFSYNRDDADRISICKKGKDFSKGRIGNANLKCVVEDETFDKLKGYLENLTTEIE